MESITNGLLLLIIGMSTVFIFLSIMVIAIEVSSRVCARYAHLLPETATAPPKKKRPTGQVDNTVLTAVIAAAVARYRQEHER